jgi:hypothetical protein
MTNEIMNLRLPQRVSCAWRLTGDNKLACVWQATNSSNKARLAPLPAESDEAGLRLCA